jgi:glucokinase
MYLGIEIGGTKLQIGLGPGDGTLTDLWRGGVGPAADGASIRERIAVAVPELLDRAGVARARLRAVGVGFGGPVDDATRRTITSHQIAGWDNFPLADWLTEVIGVPAALGNDADVAGLAEALFGAGQGLSPVFYITIGSGIGGGLVIAGRIFRGCGRGAAEIGHLKIRHGDGYDVLEHLASGWGIQDQVKKNLARGLGPDSPLRQMTGGDFDQLTVQMIGEAAAAGDPFSRDRLKLAVGHLAEGVCHVIALVCPRRVVIGGGVSLLGEGLLFGPLRERVAEQAFKPFAGLTEIVPAALGEEVVVHGALALARQQAGG